MKEESFRFPTCYNDPVGLQTSLTFLFVSFPKLFDKHITFVVLLNNMCS